MSPADERAERPASRPQYGEYATAEEQRRRIQQADATWSLDTGQHIAGPAPTPVAPTAAAPDDAQVAAGPEDPATAEARRRRRLIDRVATIGLLLYGLFNVVSSIPLFTDYSGYAETLFEMMGIDAALSDPAGARAWGLAAAIVLGLGWLLTATLSWFSLRKGRVTWWIPLVGALVFSFASGLLLMVPLFNDPAVWDMLVTGGAGG